MDCPLQARFKEIEKRPFKINAKTSFGTCIHDALEFYNKTGDISKAIERFETTWEHPELLKAKPDSWPKGTSFAELKKKGIAVLSTYHKKNVWDKRDIIASEHKFCVPIGDHELSGIVDLVEARELSSAVTELTVIDYKSQSKRPFNDDLRLNIQFCASEDTEILTSEGWKTYQSLQIGDLVMAINPETWVANWEPTSAVNVFDAVNQEMLQMEGKAHSSLTTLSHRWPVKHRVITGGITSRIENRIRLSEELTGADQIVCGAPVGNLPLRSNINDNEVAIVAWYWTEGHNIKGGSISFAQSETINPVNVLSIRDSLASLFGPPLDSIRSSIGPAWRESTDPDVTRFYLNRSASEQITRHMSDISNKVVSPKFITTLSKEQLQLFFDTSMAADGHKYVITQSVKERLDSFQIVCSLLGKRSSLRKETIGGQGRYAGRQYWSLSIKSKRPNFNPVSSVRHRVRYTGKVWCPTTPNGTWLARRNGQVWFTGNTVYYFASLQPEFWLGYDDDRYKGMPNGLELWEEFKDSPRKVVWYHLLDNKEINAGPRNEDDFGRLYRCIDEIAKAIEAGIYVPNISGSSCIWCDYTDICPVMIPPFSETPALIGKGYT